MSIYFNQRRLPKLYEFKKETIQLCLDFIKQVIKHSSQAKTKYGQKLKEIETDLYDIFCRWNFNAIQHGEFDLDTFLPTGSFIVLVDIAYYLKRFSIVLEDSFITFPFDQFELIRKRALLESKASFPIQSMTCSIVQEERLHSMYRGNDQDQDKQRLLSRYYYLGGLNNSLSIPPPVLGLFTSHELFGTPFNTCSPTYCSPFNDEQIFGSSGSFFTFTEYNQDTIYFANPPFDDLFCTNMAERLLEQLEIRPFHLIVIIPVWDNKQQEKYGLKNFNLPFDAYNKLVQSPFFIKEEFLSKQEFPFFNYFYKKYVYISNTHVINLGKPVDISLITSTWASIKNEKEKNEKEKQAIAK